MIVLYNKFLEINPYITTAFHPKCIYTVNQAAPTETNHQATN